MANENPQNKKYGGKQILVSVLFGILGIGILLYYATDWQIEPEGDALKGKPAPEIEFEMQDHKPMSISKQKGATILLNFWASWCQPCMEEMPDLRALENHFAKDGFVLLAFNIEEAGGEQIRAKLASDQMPKNLIFDFSREMLRPYDLKTIPLSVLIDKHGVVQNVYMGPRNWMDVSALQEIETILRN